MSRPTLEQLSNGLDTEQLQILAACFVTRGRDKGKLKISKPFSTKDCLYPAENATFKGMVNYVWRMLCFDFLPGHPHCCMPVTADWDLSASFPCPAWEDTAGRDQKRAIVKGLLDKLTLLIKQAESNMPVTSQAGAMRWARAFGVVQ